jgi:hypothetical protein
LLRRALAYIRANLLAMIALSVALGGSAYAANTVRSSDIVDESIQSRDILDGTVQSVDVGVGQIPGSRIHDESVKSPDLANGQVLTDDLGDKSVSTAKLQDFAVTNGKLGFSSVTADKIAGRSVGASQLALGEGWHYIGDPGQPAFENGWSNYDAGSHDSAVWQHAAFAIDTDNVVHLRGLVKGGTIGATIFTLPSSYCPWFYHLAPTLAGDALARLTMTYVTPSCSLSVAGAVNNSYVMLDPMSYTVYYYEHRVAGASANARAGDSLGGRRLPAEDPRASR